MYLFVDIQHIHDKKLLCTPYFVNTYACLPIATFWCDNFCDILCFLISPPLHVRVICGQTKSANTKNRKYNLPAQHLNKRASVRCLGCCCGRSDTKFHTCTLINFLLGWGVCSEVLSPDYPVLASGVA